MKRRSQFRVKRTSNFVQPKVKSKSLRNHNLIVLKYRQSCYVTVLDDVKLSIENKLTSKFNFECLQILLTRFIVLAKP